MTENDSSSWKIPIIVTLSIIAVVIVAFLLAQIDSLQRRSILPAKQLPIVDQDATAAAEEPNIIYLPGDAPATEVLEATRVDLTPTPMVTPLPTEIVSVAQDCKYIPRNWLQYTIQSTDSLLSLAAQFGISEKTIVYANCMTSNKINSGQVIYLPPIRSKQSDKHN
ncbi:MAG: LysM peptidoglycan-binding domain-containing protein [Candidatus Promineifilaceae bacterium]|nr:LysM peptidoglycan-binding domain-containing protein [Candidatus Promineifilaceae bacterium]